MSEDGVGDGDGEGEWEEGSIMVKFSDNNWLELLALCPNAKSVKFKFVGRDWPTEMMELVLCDCSGPQCSLSKFEKVRFHAACIMLLRYSNRTFLNCFSKMFLLLNYSAILIVLRTSE